VSAHAITLRGARASDVDAIVELINGFATQAVMLPRSPESVLLALADFVVASDERGRVLACGALKEYSPSLAEVASLAVAPHAHGRGLGRRIVAELETLARVRGIGELFALTLTPGFFEAVGYGVSERTRYPEKVRRDCIGCARRFRCAEVCVSRVLRADTFEAAA
jgi:amino-acid N-acetyltransferase